MGFYVSISITFSLCQETGKPFYYGKNFVKIYDLTTVPEVPKEYRQFIYDGYTGICIYPNYMRDDHYTDTAEDVFNEFPSWEDVEGCLCDEAKKFWTKEDHDSFYEAMKWFATSGTASYTVHWG